MSTARLQHALSTIAQAWPKDNLRPTLQFGSAIRAASARIFGADGEALSPVQLEKAERMVASLANLLGDKARKAYPITAKTTTPASFPRHYSRLLDGVAAAARGDSAAPGWFSWIRWK